MTEPFMLMHGDCLDLLRTLPDNSVDSIVTDPPYGLTQNKKGGSGAASLNLNSPAGRSRITTGGGFMGKQWDSDVPSEDIWREALRVLKPGGHLLAFFGSRTYHRGVVRIEDAGFEIRDQIMWVYGSGFPKSMDVSKAIDKAAGAVREVSGQRDVGPDMRGGNLMASEGRIVMDVTAPATPEAQAWDGWGTALKPAHEPIVVARKPFPGTVAQNVLLHGTGALNIDGCRIGTEQVITKGFRAATGQTWEATGGMLAANVEREPTFHEGRWPANLIHDGSEEVLELFPDSDGAAAPVFGTEPSEKTRGVYNGFNGERAPSLPRGDTGSAARFFYCAKASNEDRHAGLPRPGPQFKQGNTLRKVENAAPSKGNHHPTVKPVDLMRYLVRLVTRPGGVVLDPFMGSGSTGKAALMEGCSFIGMELDAEYVEIARARMTHVQPVLLPA